MADEFHHVRFRGLDIGMITIMVLILLWLTICSVPIATRSPPENVQFEIHDVNQPLRWNDNSIDLVHIRNMWMAVSCQRLTGGPLLTTGHRHLIIQDCSVKLLGFSDQVD